MAYIIGLLTKDEEKELESRGWELEPPPLGLDETGIPMARMRMVWVDSNMLEIMSGPDWEKGKIDGGT